MRNIKYNLAKKSDFKNFTPAPAKGGPKWDGKKLAVGNWFSEMQYYKLDKKEKKSEQHDCTIHNEKMEQYSIPNDQLVDMWSATQFSKQEKITRTQMVEHLLTARECVFTVTFRKKVTEKDIQEVLSEIKSDKDLQSRVKELSKQMVEGKLVTISGFLVKAEEKLGRSTIIDLAQPWNQGWRQVDHRTIEELII
jgi:hypothetical protein